MDFPRLQQEESSHFWRYRQSLMDVVISIRLLKYLNGKRSTLCQIQIRAGKRQIKVKVCMTQEISFGILC